MKVSELFSETDKAFIKLGLLFGGIPLLVIILSIILYVNLRFTEEKGKAQIEQCIAERQFDKAREIAHKIEYDYCQDEQIQIDKINQAQLGVLIADNDWETAHDMANELDVLEEYYDSFSKNIDKLLRQGKVNFVLSTLSSWQFNEAGGLGYDYNKETSPYNDNVNKLLNYAILNNNTEIIRKCYSLYRPSFTDYTNSGKRIYENTALKQAKEKVKLSGINL